MSVEHIGDGMVKVGVKQEDLENSISALQQLKPILQAQVIKSNGRNREQGIIDAKELGKHFDTAINSMIILLLGFPEYQQEEQKNE